MSTPFKMAGMSFGNSPMKQDKQGLKEKKTQLPKKYRVAKQTNTNQKTGEKTTVYEKIDQEGNSTVISEATYNSMKGQ
jgi:hypothetical protein